MSFSRLFIVRPVATTLLALAVLLAGIVSARLLPIAPLPRVDFPTIQVSSSLPGASPETMASAVATPLERQFARIAGITEITSASSLGSTSITLQFALDRDIDAAARDVQAAINAASADLPTNLPLRPTYRKANPADAPILIIALTSKTIRLGAIFDVATTILAQKVSQIEGVGQVFVGGGQQPAVRAQIDPARLAGVGLGFEDVRNAIVESTLDQPKGLLSGAKDSETIAANDQLFGADAYRQVIISSVNGAPVRLGDVASVVDGVENNRLAGWWNGTPAILLIVRRQPGASIIDTIDRVTAILPQLSSSISPAIAMNIVMDRSQTIRASVRDVERTLVIAVLLVVLVVFAFLRSATATAIPAVAVPLSLLATLALMYPLGYSLDNLSLMALTISTGFVVDDAIVMSENVARLIDEGERPFSAAIDGAKQIGFTIISITVSLLAVFIPLLLMGGIVGRLFHEFAVTLSLAVGASAIISLTLTPMMCAHLLKSEKDRRHGRLYALSERAFEGMKRGYDVALRWVLAHRPLMLIVTAATVVASVYLYIAVPKGFFPQQDTGFLAGQSRASQNVSFAAMRELQQRVNAILASDPDIENVIVFIGASNGTTENVGQMFIALKPAGVRKARAEEIIARLRPKLARAAGISVYLQATQDVRVGGRVSGAQYQYTLQDADLDELNRVAPKVLARMQKLPMLRDVSSDQQSGGLEQEVIVDRDNASRLGITLADVDNTLYDSFGQRQVATTYTELNQYRVILELDPRVSQTPDALSLIRLRSNTGALVPLDTFARYSTSSTPLSINHHGQFPAITISFNLAEGAALGDAVGAVRAAERELRLPGGVSSAFTGTAQAFQESLASEPLLFLAALFAVYVVLGVLYESYVHPITILSSLPSAGVGALLVLLLFKIDLSIIGLIGILLLIGIVKKNAIMMIDFALETERTHGRSALEAIHEASLLRFRPIMMTTVAAILGALPLVFGTGMGSELRRPLGLAVVGGLIMSQLLTLFTTPVVYVALDRFSKKKVAV